ncbi:hypothetical protein QYM36_005715 [Artemia franciscana]|uniref:Mediator of RNA polymerase II transcription subunit 19 n=1 Tax=Artemia franciscana TaxID=6661 RepID=A0AA88I1P5_ARTSF|nr:hypothetical protein QYM36_005715 [Artemia franciscana]
MLVNLCRVEFVLEHVDSLRLLIEKPPIGGKELHPLNSLQLTGFRLHPGVLPEDFKQTLSIYQGGVKKKKKKKDKYRGGDISGAEGSGAGSGAEASQDGYEKKHKKQKKSEEEKDKKKRKKEKKKKRQKHSPEYPGSAAPGTPKLL